MNFKSSLGEKGIYTVMVALLAIILISSSIFNARAGIVSGIGVNSNAINMVAAGWQNARYLLDKTTSDAMDDVAREKIESDVSKSCVPAISAGEYGGRISSYYITMQGNLIQSSNLECTSSSVSTSVNALNPRQFDTILSLYCKAGTVRMREISFNDAVKFRKTINLSKLNSTDTTPKSGTQTCNDKHGAICSAGLFCANGSWIASSDSERCCSGDCVTRCRVVIADADTTLAELDHTIDLN